MNLKALTLALALCISFAALASPIHDSRFAVDGSSAFRPPAVPLVTTDPYLSIWSEADNLTDDVTRHWTHVPHPLVSLISIDGQSYRLMGNEPATVPPLPQTGLEVTATRSIYHFANRQVRVTLTFMTPLLPDDLDVYSRPVTYLTWSVASADGVNHLVRIFDSMGSAVAVNTPNQAVESGFQITPRITAIRVGSQVQNFLRPEGDDTRIDWGYGYLATADDDVFAARGSASEEENWFVSNFAKNGRGLDRPLPKKQMTLGSGDDLTSSKSAEALYFDLGAAGARPVACRAMIAYDEIYSIYYFGSNLRPYWRRNGMTMMDLLRRAANDCDSLTKRCIAFDDRLVADANRVGGPEYARIVSLAYRECVAATGLAADSQGSPLLFTKEDTSNGDIATVDVIFPMEPIWILLNPTLAKASLVSEFDYAGSPHWKFPNAPHDLGTYPRVFGRDDGGEGMPVEESGNMIILTDAIAHDENSPEFASKYWKQLTQWAHYLEKYGLDPEDQLCTDDFMGHLAHNANLSVKAILALAAYGDLCRMRGDFAQANRYRQLAKQDANHWVKVADAGDHSLLAFDKPGTWSQKYNLVWDRLLGLNVFPSEVAEKEVAYYKSMLQTYGIPLDSRTHLTKTDWSIWSSTMARSKTDFENLIAPTYRYLDETTTRDPIADSYMTDDVHSGGMHARPVVGGLFIRMLSDPEVWHKWVRRDGIHFIIWAPMPKMPLPPVVTEVVPTARTGHETWKYTTDKPAAGWQQPSFDDSSWLSGEAGLGTEGTPGIIVRTKWDTDDIWVRRTFTMPAAPLSRLRLLVYHDEDVEVYINGVFAASEPSFVTKYSVLDIAPKARKLLVSGAKITIAAHCHQTTGGQGIDIGLGVVG